MRDLFPYRKTSRGFLILLCLLPLMRSALIAQNQPSREYQLKAIFMFHFTQFVQWPETAFPDADAPFVIGILGDDPFGTYLDETIQNESVNGRPLLVQRYRSVQEIKYCHILYINKDEFRNLNQILKTANNKSMLTVSDGEQFAVRGGMIRFLTEEGKIKLRINLAVTKKAELVISSKLLALAEICCNKI